MSSIPRDEIIFGFTENEVKLLIMSLKCIEAHGNRLFLNCTCLAQLTGYSSAYAYESYQNDLFQKIIALPAVNLNRVSDDQKRAGAATAAVVSQAPTSAAEGHGKTDSGTIQDKEKEKEKEKAEKNNYNGIRDGVDGAGGDPEDEKELEALGSAYARDC